MTGPGQTWDAIVIGSGLGGLTAAAYLTTNGVRTLVLEQSDAVGGFSRVFRERGFEFDVGLHYIGDCGPDGAIPTLLRGVGLEGKVEFLEMDPDGFSTLIFPDLTFRVPRGWDRYLEALIEAFPAEERALTKCVGVLERIGRELDREPPPIGFRSTISYPLRAPTIVRWGLRPLRALYESCGLSREARALISAESGDYASPPSRAPVAAHAGLLHHFLKSGAYYPRGGGQVIAANLVDVIKAHGGEVHTDARVDEILVEGRRTVGVRLHGGEKLPARVVVSNADLKRTYLELLRPEHVKRRTAARIRRYRMALPLFCVYLGLDLDLRDRMPNTNYWCHPSADSEAMYRAAYSDEPDAEVFTKPPVFITTASVKDPDSEHIAPPGCSSLELITVVPSHRHFWGVSDRTAAIEAYRDEPAYLAAKQRVGEALVDRAAELIPGLREHIVWQDAATPLTHERRMLSSGGACYGIEVATDQFGPRRPGAGTELRGLYLAGASTVWGGGIVGVMAGGAGTAGAVLGRDLHAEIRSGRVFGTQ